MLDGVDREALIGRIADLLVDWGAGERAALVTAGRRRWSPTATTRSSTPSRRGSRRRARPGATTRPIRSAGASRGSRIGSCCGRGPGSKRATRSRSRAGSPCSSSRTTCRTSTPTCSTRCSVDAGYAEVANGLTVLAGPKVFAKPIRRMASLCFGAIKMPQSQSTASGEAVMPRREVARLAQETLADRRGTAPQGRPADGVRRGHAQPHRDHAARAARRCALLRSARARRSFRSGCGAPRS